MTTRHTTTRQSLDALRQESLALLYSYAEVTRDSASHQWQDAARRERCAQLASYIKRDLLEFKNRLTEIADRNNTLSEKVLSNPHHPSVLNAGGAYVSFIEDATAALNPMVGELLELLADDVASLETQLTAAR